MDLQLKDKKAVVFAGSKGIGRGVAMALVQEGCDVMITSHNESNLKAAKADLDAVSGGAVGSFKMNIQSVKDVERGMDQILRESGPVDILVTNGPGPKVTAAAETTCEDFEEAIETNLLSVIAACRKVIPGMIDRKFGRLIHLTSTTGKEPDAGMVLSNVTRAGVLAYSKTLSREIARHGITSNAILTGGVLTERVTQLREARAKQLGVPMSELDNRAAQTFPVGYIATPEQFSQAIAFLASPLSVYVNGVSLPIDGGMMRGI